MSSAARWAGAAAVAAAAVAGGALLARERAPAPALPAAVSVAATAAAPAAPATPSAATVDTTPAAPASNLPPGVDPATWARLQQQYAAQPAELQRLFDHYVFADAMARFRPSRGAERLALAQRIDALLDERLRQRELSAPEARLVKAAVLQELVADEAERQAALERWQSQWPAAQADPAATARDAEFHRRQAEIVAAWNARPPAERDRRALEQALEALRRTSFAR